MMAENDMICAYCKNENYCFVYERATDDVFAVFERSGREFDRNAQFCKACIRTAKSQLIQDDSTTSVSERTYDSLETLRKRKRKSKQFIAILNWTNS